MTSDLVSDRKKINDGSAEGSSEIAKNSFGVANAAESTSSAVVETQCATDELAQMASELQQIVGKFRV